MELYDLVNYFFDLTKEGLQTHFYNFLADLDLELDYDFDFESLLDLDRLCSYVIIFLGKKTDLVTKWPSLDLDFDFECDVFFFFNYLLFFLLKKKA